MALIQSNLIAAEYEHKVAKRELSEENRAYRDRALAAGKDFLAAVDEILPIIEEGRYQSERDGKVPQRSVDAMIEAGVFRTFTPMQFGGLEVDPASFFEGIMRIAEADSSAAWIAGQLNVHSFEIALMDERMQQEFWGSSPDTRASSSYAPIGKYEKVDGGYILNGTWTFSSGVDHAQWVIVGGGDRNFVVPVEDLVIDHDSWDVKGLKGTGSKAVTLTDVFVPDYRCHILADTYNDANPGWKVNDRPLYRLSFMGIFNSTAPNTVIGTAIKGLNVFIQQSKVRLTRQGTGVPIVQNPFLHLKIADGLTRVNTVRERHLNNWRELFEQACRGEESTPLERLRIRFEAADAIDTCFNVIANVWPMAGAAASASSNLLQLIFRDLMAARNHGAAGRELAATMYIQTLFGMPTPSFEENPNMGTLAFYR